MSPVPLEIEIGDGLGVVSARLHRPDEARALLVLAHGAGADMHHPFMVGASEALAAARIGTLRFQFPYTEAGRRMPDRQAVLTAAVRAAVGAAREQAPDLPLLAGGKSMGGRMTSLAQADTPLEGVAGLVFFGFPLHPTGKPGTARAAHLESVGLPMLFLQGARDTLADPDLLRGVVTALQPRASLHVVEGADHGFKIPKRLGTAEDVRRSLAATTRSWLDRRLQP